MKQSFSASSVQRLRVEQTLALIRDWPKPASGLAARARLQSHHPCSAQVGGFGRVPRSA
jgi:hypothetical protein